MNETLQLDHTNESRGRSAPARPARGAYRWVVFATAVFSTAVGMVAWGAVFPLLPLWIDDLQISRAQGGLLFSLYFLPGIVLALPGGWALDRAPMRLVLAAAWMCIVVGTVIMATAPGFLGLCAGRLLFAAGMNVHQIGAPKLVAAWFEGRREFGLIMGLYTWGYTLGIAASFTGLGWYGQHAGWRSALLALAALTVVGGLAIVPAARKPDALGTFFSGRAPSMRLLPSGSAIWVLAIVWLFYNAGLDSYKTFTPDYLVRRGHSVTEAASVTSLYLWIGFLLKPVCAAWLTPRTGPWLAAAGGVLSIAGFLLLLQPAIAPGAIALCFGASIGLTMPAITALPAMLLGSERAGQGYGLCQLFYSLCFLAQPLVGWSIDVTGAHVWAYALMSVYAAIAVSGAMWLALSRRSSMSAMSAGVSTV